VGKKEVTRRAVKTEEKASAELNQPDIPSFRGLSLCFTAKEKKRKNRNGRRGRRGEQRQRTSPDPVPNQGGENAFSGITSTPIPPHQK